MSENVRYIDDIFSEVKRTKRIPFTKPRKSRFKSKILYFDFYEPLGDNIEKRPLIVYAFGGAFLIGWRSQPPIPLMANKWVKKGYAVVSIDYRKGFNPMSNGSAARAVYRAIQDLSAALRFLVHHAEQYRIDPYNIILAGSSSGSITSLHLAYMEPHDLEQVNFFKYNDLGSLYASGNDFLAGQYIPVKAIVNLWGAMFDLSFFKDKKPKNTPALISFHGKGDFIVHHKHRRPLMNPFFMKFYGSTEIHKRLDQLGVKNKKYFLNEQFHEPSIFTKGSRDFIVNKSVLFLKEVLDIDE